MSKDVTIDIHNVFENNKLNDLNTFMCRRKCLNISNIILIYSFHIVQSAGIFITTLAAGNDDKKYIWLGIGLNIFASLLHVFERTNHSLSKKILSDIVSIKNNTYIDETDLTVTDINHDNQKSKKTIREAGSVATPTREAARKAAREADDNNNNANKNDVGTNKIHKSEPISDECNDIFGQTP
jgi:hypothetical protein